jgi:lipoprotein Spr
MKKVLALLITIFVVKLSFTQDFINNGKYQGDPLYDFITEWWKTPYRYGGTTKRGIDCSAFTRRLVDRVYGVQLPRTASEQYRSSKRVKRSELKDGDLVFFRTRVASGWHVGVYLTDGWFVHSKSRAGVIFSNLNDPNYKRIFYAAGRILK